MKFKIIILLLTSLCWVACSSNPTELEEVSGPIIARSLAIGNQNQLFAATKDGLYQSLDDGETWRFTNRYNSKLVSVTKSGTIYCLRSEDDGIYTTKETLWRSTDGGKTFLITGWVKNKVPFLNGMDWITFNKQEHIFVSAGDGSLYRSTSNGQTWDYLSPIGVNPIISPSNIFKYNTIGISRSDDNGNNWIKVLDLQFIPGDSSYSCNALTYNSQGRIFAAINVSAKSEILETGMIYLSDDDGNNWSEFVASSSHISQLAVDSEDNIFAITKLYEVYRSMDNGVQWNKVSENFPESYVKQFMISVNNKLFIRTQDNKIYRSRNNGVNWEQI